MFAACLNNGSHMLNAQDEARSRRQDAVGSG